MTKFENLEFTPYRDGNKACVQFANGYGASVICHDMSYGGREGLYELAVMKDDEICYSTPVTDDVLGWLYPSDVTAILGKIEQLPPA